MTIRIRFKEKKINFKSIFNKGIGPVIGVTLFSLLMENNYNLRKELDFHRKKEFSKYLEIYRAIGNFYSFIDTTKYHQMIDSLKILEDRLYKQEKILELSEK